MDRRALLALLGAACLAVSRPGPASELERLLSEKPRPLRVLHRDNPAPAQSQQCCRVCRAGKACGNSCIAQDKQCHQPPGCACDG
jgi:hypothetical protein